MEESFIRTEMLIGKEALERLKNSTVAVFGIGGVGGFVTEALARCGIGKLVLVDFDTVSISNINRQIIALNSTVNKLKVDVIRDRIKDINPDIQVKSYAEVFNKDSSDKIMNNELDYVVDAIDMVSSKIHLIELCKKMNIPIISSMGTGNKINPTMLEVGDIYDTSICPLARVMRRELRKRNIESLKVVYSKEVPIKRDEYIPQDNSRPVPASISFVPSCAGLIIASEVVKDLAKIENK
ncbi:tRNA threonylcarbamoyladenosine dehydratase [Abyssisolibacter fermentans]|uniref:tRNA threonylcarbamoyladenosine dehydratase n=1 Tax=Abyssisolibacter fermentans TaxID=1766203 RepID=UPI00082B4C5E|nr:tRNA threonylcarbamoyladenosine dehydratase [Abyssisolibacter fermentans]